MQGRVRKERTEGLGRRGRKVKEGVERKGKEEEEDKIIYKLNAIIVDL